MSNPDTNPFAALSGYFFGNDKNDPRVNPQLRQRIALAMMAGSKRPYPKNLGEGLSAIGEAIGERGQMRALMDSDIAQQDQAVKLLGSTGAAAPAQAASLAPTESVTSQPQVIPPPAPPPAPPPQAPGRGFTPTPMQPGAGEIIDSGEYNAIDAADPRNRYKPAPAYLQPALDRNIADPERRGYLGQTAGKEAQRPGEVSPTGAAGPFQFTQETGAGYGIPGNARFDPDASTLAANRFTDDNVKTLTARLGREPTPGEMALAHQQGAGTAANMLTGTGNASDYNLKVNKVPLGLGPQASANKIMGYYGMPGPGVTTPGPRDAVAAALDAQQQPQSPQRLSVADYGQPRALAATPPDSLPPEISAGASAISAAPPQPSGIRAAPQQQVAQAQPQAVPGYVPPEATGQRPPPIVKVDPELLRLRALSATAEVQNNGYAQTLLKARMDPLEAEHAIKQNAANELYKSQLQQDAEQNKIRQNALVNQTKNAAEVAHLEQQAATGEIVEMPDGNKYRYNPKTKVMTPIPIEGQTNAEPILPKNEFQLKSMKHYEQMKEADKIIGNGDALRSGASTTGAQVPIVGGFLQSDAYRKQRAAAERWVTNKLRQESGATIKDDEMAREVRAYFPIPSDDAKTVADKTAARKIANEGMLEASGREGKAYQTWKAQKEAATVADAVQWLKNNPNDPDAAKVRKRLGL